MPASLPRVARARGWIVVAWVVVAVVTGGLVAGCTTTGTSAAPPLAAASGRQQGAVDVVRSAAPNGASGTATAADGGATADPEGRTPDAARVEAAPPAAAAFPWPADPRRTGTCDRPTWPAITATDVATAPGRGRRVLVVGDSLTRETALARPGTSSRLLVGALRSRGWVPTVVCAGGRQTPWALEQVRVAARLGLLPDRVVIGLGTNDLLIGHLPPEVFATRAAAVLAAIGSLPTRSGLPVAVWWVNQWVDLAVSDRGRRTRAGRSRDDMRRFPQYNEALVEVCDSRTRCRIVDWAARVRAAGDRSAAWIVQDDDGSHLTTPGSRARSWLVVDALR